MREFDNRVTRVEQSLGVSPSVTATAAEDVGVTGSRRFVSRLILVLLVALLCSTSCGGDGAGSESLDGQVANAIAPQVDVAKEEQGRQPKPPQVGRRPDVSPSLTLLVHPATTPLTAITPTVRAFDSSIRLDRSRSLIGDVTRVGVPTSGSSVKGVQANVPASVSPLFLTEDAKIVVCAKRGDAPPESEIQSMASGLIEPDDNCYGWLMGLETTTGKPAWMIPFVKREGDPRLATMWQIYDSVAVSPDHSRFALRNPDLSVSIHDSANGDLLFNSPVFDTTVRHANLLIWASLPGQFTANGDRFLRYDTDWTGNVVITWCDLDGETPPETMMLRRSSLPGPSLFARTALDPQGSVFAMLEMQSSPDRVGSDMYVLQVWRLGQEHPVVAVRIKLGDLIEAETSDYWSPHSDFSSLQFVADERTMESESASPSALAGELVLSENVDGQRSVRQHFSFFMEDATNSDTLQIVANARSDSLLLTSESVECSPLRHMAIRSSAYAANVLLDREGGSLKSSDSDRRNLGMFTAIDFAGRRSLSWSLSQPPLHYDHHRIPLARSYLADSWMPHLIVGDGSRRAVLDLANGLRTTWTVRSATNDRQERPPEKHEFQPGSLDVVDVKNARFVASLRYLGDMSQHWSLHAVASCPQGKFLLTQLVVVPVPTDTSQSEPMDQATFYRSMSDGKTVSFTVWELP
jgi:hypothetical protein